MKSPMIAALVLTLAACTMPQPVAPTISLPNPASAYCVKQGGRLDLRRDPQGNVSGVCVFPNGNECDEWALFRDHQCVAPHRAAPAPDPSHVDG